MTKEIKPDLGKYEDTLHRVRSFLETAQFLSRNAEEREIQLSLLSQAEDEIRKVLGYE